jgi:outer membrane protein assembly factor BamB
MTKLSTFLICTLFLLSSCSEEVSQWRGPDRDGIYSGKGLLEKWPEGGPNLIFKTEDMGRGLSQADKDVIYITGIKSDTMDVISAYDLKGNLSYSFM